MGCCQPPSESKILFCFLAAGTLLLWLVNPRLGAAATALLAVLYFCGSWLLARMNVVVTRCELAVRQSRRVRRPGLLYCPECGLHLASRADGKPVMHYLCPSCGGAWCGSEDLAAFLSRGAAQWKTDPADGAAALPCPKCTRPLEAGGWAGAPVAAHRCPACLGTWVPRMSWLWFEMGLPRA